jgi:hypothetical protein
MLPIINPEPEQNQMANRTSKSPAHPVKRNTTAKVSYFRELPGAVFFGDLADEDIDHAVHMQKIRTSYESSGDQEFLWLDCQEMGFESNEIQRFMASPERITSCGYYGANALR